MEYWIVFDTASGAELWRGAGQAGSAAAQQLPEGADIAIVPQAALATPQVDLSILRSSQTDRIDRDAEATRQRFLTPGSGQAMTYTRKETEARTWTADNSAAVPFLTAEAAARGMTIAALAAEVIALSDAWTMIGSAIEGLRMGAKRAVALADTVGAIVAAARVDWDAVSAPAA